MFSRKDLKKRGQAALEFLTTYGWAFMVILVMIGALAYFGVLNPDRFLPERCSIGPEFSCDEHILSAGGYNRSSGEMRVVLSNQVGDDITNATVEEVSWDGESGYDGSAECTFNRTNGTPIDWSTDIIRAGEQLELRCNNMPTQGFSAEGSKLAVDVGMQYRPQGNEYKSSVFAEVFTTVNEDVEFN